MSPRPERVAELNQLVSRQLATKASLLQHAMAGKLGMSVTDLKCIDLLRQAVMPLTPVNLAELTGLTSGAITGVADRLQQAGFVERVRSETDRRRWELRLRPERQKELAALFEPLHQAMADLCHDYSDDDLGVVIAFLTKLGPIMDAETVRLHR